MEAGLSIVVPVYAGEEYLEDLASKISVIRQNLIDENAPFGINELIFVDDAAIDASPRIIDEIAGKHDWVIALHLSRNFGQHAATNAGILHSAGSWIVTMDEDMQHPPDRILSLLEKAVEGHLDLVYANAAEGVHKSLFRDLGSRGFKRLMRQLIDNPYIENFNSFRLIRGPVARAAASVSTHDTYFDISLSWFTQRIGVRVMDLIDARYVSEGKSGYSFRSLLSHAWRMLFSSQIKLLRITAIFGFLVLGVASISMIYFLSQKIFWPDTIPTRGWTSLFIAISFFGGLLALMSGIILQYLSTLVLQAHGKPRFFVVDRSADDDIAAWFARRAT